MTRVFNFAKNKLISNSKDTYFQNFWARWHVQLIKPKKDHLLLGYLPQEQLSLNAHVYNLAV